jgi:8-oxo-dGTP pyrophosphatase MutT (NUDIX family)
MSAPHYVLLVVADEPTGHVIGLTKLRGPAAVVGKINFPGGKVEEGESVYEAAQRELKEETGLLVPKDSWHVFAVNSAAGFKITALLAQSSKVLYARTAEDEPIWHLSIKEHLAYSQKQPAQYAPGFHALLEMALSHLAFVHEED